MMKSKISDSTDAPAARGPVIDSRPGQALLLVIVFGLIGFALRFYRLEDWGLWIDELFTVDHSIELFSTGLTFRPVGFFLHGLWLELNGFSVAALPSAQYDAWQALGISTFHMRFPSAIVGALSIPLLIWTLRRLLTPIELAVFACAITFSVWHVWMSQVARFYSVQFVLFALALILYYRATESGNFRLFCWSMAATAAAFFTQATSLMLVGIFALDWLFVTFVQKRGSLWRASEWGALVTTIAVCIAWVVAFYVLEPSDYTQFQAGHQSLTTMIAGSVFLAGLSTVLLAGACSIVLWRENPRWAFFLTSAWFVPVIAFVALRYLGKPVHVRYIFVALFPCLMLFSIAVARLYNLLRAKVGFLFAVTPVVGFLSAIAMQTILYFGYGDGYRAKWPQAAAFVKKHRKEGDALAGAQGGVAMAQYYLGVADVDDFADVIEAHAQKRLTRSTWVIARVYEPSLGWRASRAEVPGVLKAYFANQVSQPRHVVNVLYLEANAPGS